MNIKKLKALSRVTCEATVNLSNAYKAAKEFVDAYEREQRHVAQERKWSSEKQRAYGKLLDCAIGRMSRETICNAAIELAEACKPEREEHEQRHFAQKRELSYEDFECLLNLAEAVRRKLLPDKVCDEKKHEARAVPVNWSVEKDNAYHALTEAIFERKPLSTIQKAAITFVDICNREERKKPETGDIYRDIFGNRYAVATEEFLDGEQPRVGLIRVGTKGEAIFPEFLTPTLEDFMNPTFKKV